MTMNLLIFLHLFAQVSIKMKWMKVHFQDKETILWVWFWVDFKNMTLLTFSYLMGIIKISTNLKK